MSSFRTRRPAAALLAAAAMVAAGPALAQSHRTMPQPVVLSPDLTEPWLTQIDARGRPRLSFPTPFAPPAAVTPSQAPAAPTQVAARADARAQPLDPRFLPQMVAYSGREAPGTIVIDTDAKFLYLVMPNGQARRYGVGVGRPGFEWAGVHTITRKAEWPGWTPPPQMRRRQPWLPAHMEGGPNNPLGARAMYLGSTLYRIHGTSEPWTIGHAVSSGCIRMRNEDVTDLYGRVGVGTRVIVS